MKFAESSSLFERAAVIPGRSNTRSKAPGKFFDVDAGPLYASRAYGSEIFDADGNRFIDMLCALGAISIGYGWIREYGYGSLSLPHKIEVEASERIIRDVAPWATHVRSVRTGSEATTAAVLVARRSTGRRPIFVASNAYHAWHPWAAFRERHGTEGEWTFSYRYGDLDSVKNLVAEAGRPAAVVVEPARFEATPFGYLKELQDYARSLGSLFVVDEMIYGGRWALGGACELYGLKPDLATFGKAFGNGQPVAFVAGCEHLKDFGEAVSGTYSGDAGALAAVVDVLNFYDRRSVVRVLWENGTRLAKVVDEAITAAGVRKSVVHEYAAVVHQRLRFDPLAATLSGFPKDVGRTFSAEMATRGVLWHPDVVNVCYAHASDQIDKVGEAARESFLVLKEAGAL